MNENLDQECVKGGGGGGELLSFQGKIARIALDFSGKMTAFCVLTLLFHLPLPKIWFFHPHTNHIFDQSNNRAIR